LRAREVGRRDLRGQSAGHLRLVYAGRRARHFRRWNVALVAPRQQDLPRRDMTRVRILSTLAALLALAAPAVAANPNGAHVHGVVLAVTPGDGQAIVRHDPFGGMPSMS